MRQLKPRPVVVAVVDDSVHDLHQGMRDDCDYDYDYCDDDLMRKMRQMMSRKQDFESMLD